MMACFPFLSLTDIEIMIRPLEAHLSEQNLLALMKNLGLVIFSFLGLFFSVHDFLCHV